MARRTGVGVLLLAAVLGACAAADDPGAGSSTTIPTVTGGRVVVAVGDLICSEKQEAAADGSPAQCQSEATAALAKSLSPDAVLFLGDIQYERGTTEEFAAGYANSSWAQMKAITHPAVGNHEYSTTGAAPYFATFAGAAGPSRRGWYSLDVGDWHVIALNSNCRPAGGCEVGSPQETWLRDDLAASSRQVHARLLASPAVDLGTAQVRRVNGAVVGRPR